ncbi:hypothetical protein, partial [Pantoea septica]|uniref:hypothetical protein n=1 Tax=Pantoea septica TaxID=472695 RepID=UPI0028AE17B1
FPSVPTFAFSFLGALRFFVTHFTVIARCAGNQADSARTMEYIISTEYIFQCGLSSQSDHLSVCILNGEYWQ